MIDQRLTDELALRALNWRKGPGRYVKSGRGWTPESKFRPLSDLRDSFRVLDSVTDNYSLIAEPGGTFDVQVRVAGRTGRFRGEDKARAICFAIASALGIDWEEDR